MQCAVCKSTLIYLYFRDNKSDGSRSWIKTKNRYCKRCKVVYKKGDMNEYEKKIERKEAGDK